MNPARKPWWQQATALVSISTGGAITGFSFAPGTPADMTSPASMPVHLMALEKSAQPSQNADGALRSAIVNVANYYLRMAASKSPAEMEAIIWQHDSVDGVDHGESCAAFASLTLELGAQAVGQQSWVTGGTSYPWPLHPWADVRVDPNSASLNIVSVLQDAQAHNRWHPLGDGYRPKPGDWVLFDGHVEVVTQYSGGVLYTIGGDSGSNLSVNAHQYGDPLSSQGVAGFVNNGDLASTGSASGQSQGSPGATSPHGGATSQASASSASASSASAASQRATRAAQGQAAIPGMPVAGSTAPGGGQAPASHAAAGSPSLASRHGAARPSSSTPAPRSEASAPSEQGSADAEEPTSPSGAAQAAPAPRSQPPRATAAISHSDHAHSQAGLGAVAAMAVPLAGPSAAPATASTQQAAGTATIPGVPLADRAPAHQHAASAAPYRRHNPSPATVSVPATTSQQAFINEVAPGAIAAQHRWGVPASVTIAQAIEESTWGQSSLAVNDHNLFGIKGSGPAGSDMLPTQEYQNGQYVSITAPFRVYHNVAESISDHGQLLATSGYYTQAMADRAVPDAFANDLTGIYATDPNYGANLIALMKLYNLYQYDTASPAPTSQAAAPQAGSPAAPHATPSAGHAGSSAQHAAGSHASHAAWAGASQAPASAPHAAKLGGTAIPGLMQPVQTTAATYPGGAAGSQPSAAPNPYASSAAQATLLAQVKPLDQPAPRPHRHATAYRPMAHAASTAETVFARRVAEDMGQPAPKGMPRDFRASAGWYQQLIPRSVMTAFITTAKAPLMHAEPLYRDVAADSGLRWELLAACDWMQCKAHPKFSPVHGEKLGTANADGTVYRTKSEALSQCAIDLIELAAAVYQIDLTDRAQLSVRDLARAFAAFRWGGLLKMHDISPMEFPYSVAGLTARHLKMRWPEIGDPNTPDKPGTRFRMPFGAVPIILGLHYPAVI